MTVINIGNVCILLQQQELFAWMLAQFVLNFLRKQMSLRTFSICITNISFHESCISLSFNAWCLLFLDLIRLAACWECRVGAEHCNSRLVQIATTQQSKDPCCRFLPLNSCHLIHSTRLHWCNKNGKMQCPRFPLGRKGCSFGHYRLGWPIHLPEAMPIYVNLSHAPHWTWLNFLAFASSI